ncbi:hypothetical protein LJR042_003198 [Microbacterium maritypicum]|uniref:hypothetical protein n=1 Tax=Microbacterium TaxID=33882 RepID=UPI00141E7D30|nr:MULTISPECIES: hypothetical protein [Microbacterium]NIG65842.1 hypothetical protein [Microbacterium sp. Be9]
MVSPSDSAVVEARSAPQTTAGRSLAVIGLTIPLMLLIDYAVSYATVVALFGGLPFVLIAAILVAFAVLAGGIALLSTAFTGRPAIFGGVVAAGVLTCAGAFGLVHGILGPLALQTDALLHVAVCALAALTLGIFLGPMPLRVAGAVSAAALVAVLALVPTPTETAAVDRANAEADRSAEVKASWIRSGKFPLVTDLAGWSNVEVRATGTDAATWVRSDTGSVARIIIQWNAVDPDPLAPCNFIGGPGREWDRGPDQLPSWCVRTGDQWSRSDGTAVYSYDAGTGTTMWIMAFGGYDAERVGGSTAATAEDIAALIPSLHPMSREDAERYLLPTFDGIDSPEVQTPDL